MDLQKKEKKINSSLFFTVDICFYNDYNFNKKLYTKERGSFMGNLKEKFNSKLFLHTWFIGLTFSFSYFHWIFLCIGIVLTVLQYFFFKPYFIKYGKCEYLDESIRSLEFTKEKYMEELEQEYANRKQQIKNDEAELCLTLDAIKDNIKAAECELAELESKIVIEHYNFSDYDGLSSEDCKNKLAILKNDEQNLIKSGKALSVESKSTKKSINDNSKQILRCFNSECDNILMNLSVKNIDSMRSKITKSFETLNKLFSIDGIKLEKQILEYKLEELNLVYTFEVKHEQERELQKEIKAQMLEEEKVRREIEAQKSKIEKDQLQCSKEIDKLISYLHKSQNDTEKQLYIDKIKELEDKLKELEKSKETVLEREANAKAGFVYIISNIGSFGENIYKIGMTRRLEPMDRIKELSSASVPFEFDVHAMIFADDAPSLETALHQHFEKNSVNRINLRKEFFNVSLEEIEQVVKDNFNNTVEFTKIPVAKEYRQTLNILESEKAS